MGATRMRHGRRNLHSTRRSLILQAGLTSPALFSAGASSPMPCRTADTTDDVVAKERHPDLGIHGLRATVTQYAQTMGQLNDVQPEHCPYPCLVSSANRRWPLDPVEGGLSDGKAWRALPNTPVRCAVGAFGGMRGKRVSISTRVRGQISVPGFGHQKSSPLRADVLF